MLTRIKIEDTLKHLHDCDYRGRAASLESISGALSCDLESSAELLELLQSKQLVKTDSPSIALTEKGREYAREVIRAHRLYETYLATKTGLAESEWHRQAEKMEHLLSDTQVDQIAHQLGYPRYDPHGDPIPTADGKLPPKSDRTLVGCGPNWEGRVTHLEDEPHSLYQELIDAGLAPGMRLKVLEPLKNKIRINLEGREISLSQSAAANLMVAPFVVGDSFDAGIYRLSDLKLNQSASIAELSPACRGADRNRLLDLGLVPGTQVTLILTSPAGGPCAYRIRGASIALRREQADKILIRETEQATR